MKQNVGTVSNISPTFMKRTRLALSFLEFSSVLGDCQSISTPSISRSSIICATLVAINWTEDVALEKSSVDTERERMRRKRPPFMEPVARKNCTSAVMMKERKKERREEEKIEMTFKLRATMFVERVSLRDRSIAFSHERVVTFVSST